MMTKQRLLRGILYGMYDLTIPQQDIVMRMIEDAGETQEELWGLREVIHQFEQQNAASD